MVWKPLWLGVCLVAASGGANSAQAADAHVSSGLSLKISGWFGFLAGLSINRTGAEDLDREYDFATGARLQFDIKSVTDSGLEYGGRIRMNNVDRRNNVTIDRVYAYLKGRNGTLTVGDATYAGGDLGYVYAHDTLNSKLGLGAGWGDGLDGKFYLFGGSDAFYALDPTAGLGGLNGKDTKIKYTSPSIAGFSFAFDFTPVAGGRNAANSPGTGGGTNDHAGPGGANDLINDRITRYENVITGGVNYANTFDGTAVRLAISASTANGVGGNHDLKAYTFGGQIGLANGVWASVNWVHFSSTFRADKAIDSIVGDLSHASGPFVVSLGYAYTIAEKGNLLRSTFTNGADLETSHSAALSLLYNFAPGFSSFTELIYERNEFRSGQDYEASSLTSGLVLAF
ncbi:porin [Inquilinus sp.]|uniref:porin n=1 Tax=Inquilinus sp. TaxID=1932117 RepID=UPI0031DE6A20